MKHLVTNSRKYDCAIHFYYGDNGMIRGFMIDRDVTDTEFLDLQNGVFIKEADLRKYCEKNKVQITEVLEDLSFDRFWNTYNYKNGGSKKKAQQIWAKMSDTDRAKALAYIAIYRRHLATSGISQAYATTYLNDQRWEN